MKRLSIEHLKILACITMLIDHISAVFYPSGVLRAVGRVAFPLFCFALCQGFYHTRNKRKYLLRLGACAVVTEPIFDLLFHGGFTWNYQNVLVTLFLGLLMLTLMERLQKPVWRMLTILLFYVLAELFRTDYAGAGILTVALFALSCNKRGALLIQTVGLLLIQLSMNSVRVSGFGLRIPLQVFAMGAMLPIALYSGKKLTRSRVVQWIFYLFYPAHIALLYLIIKISGNPL